MYFIIAIVVIIFLVRRNKKRQGIATCSNCGRSMPIAAWHENNGCPDCQCREKVRVPFLGKSGFPKWFNMLNLLALVPILPWPGVVLATVMLSDSGKHMDMLVPLIILALVYPAIILWFRYLSYYFYNRNKAVAIGLPLISVSLLVAFMVAVAYPWVNFLWGNHMF